MHRMLGNTAYASLATTHPFNNTASLLLLLITVHFAVLEKNTLSILLVTICNNMQNFLQHPLFLFSPVLL